jgi:hypothetical protein
LTQRAEKLVTILAGMTIEGAQLALERAKEMLLKNPVVSAKSPISR